jgi:hypothetical protein
MPPSWEIIPPLFPDHRHYELPGERRNWGLGSSGTENSAKAFSFLNTRSDFLTVAVVPPLLATPSAALGDLASSASVAARPTRGDDVLEDHGANIINTLQKIVFHFFGLIEFSHGLGRFRNTEDWLGGNERETLRSDAIASSHRTGSDRIALLVLA